MMRKQREIDMTNDEMKQYTLGNMAGMLEQLRQKVNVLNALDRDTTTSGSYDLHDQLTSMFQALDKFDTAVMNAVKVVPSK
jgi:beta-galactosidase beta subunit